jgi:hypothetical protein
MDAVTGHHSSDSALDVGLRVLGASDAQVGAEAFARVSGEIAEGLSAFADVGIEMNEALDWQATAGLKWRW